MEKFAFHVEFSKITWGFLFNNTLCKDYKNLIHQVHWQKNTKSENIFRSWQQFPTDRIELLETNFDS